MRSMPPAASGKASRSRIVAAALLTAQSSDAPSGPTRSGERTEASYERHLLATEAISFQAGAFRGQVMALAEFSCVFANLDAFGEAFSRGLCAGFAGRWADGCAEAAS